MLLFADNLLVKIVLWSDEGAMSVEYSQFIHKVSGQTFPFCHSEGETH